MRGSQGSHQDLRALLALFTYIALFSPACVLIFFALQNAVHLIGICFGAPRGIAMVGFWMATGFSRRNMQYMHRIYICINIRGMYGT